MQAKLVWGHTSLEQTFIGQQLVDCGRGPVVAGLPHRVRHQLGVSVYIVAEANLEDAAVDLQAGYGGKALKSGLTCAGRKDRTELVGVENVGDVSVFREDRLRRLLVGQKLLLVLQCLRIKRVKGRLCVPGGADVLGVLREQTLVQQQSQHHGLRVAPGQQRQGGRAHLVAVVCAHNEICADPEISQQQHRQYAYLQQCRPF